MSFNMELKMQNLLIYFILVLLFSTAEAFFDIEELKSFNYGIDIRNEPVVMKAESEESDTSTVQLTSKYGQPYQCNFPNTVEQEKQKEEAEKVAMETGIPDLLKPMEGGPCLRKTKDWWSYEFCYGKVIKQYHLGDEGTIDGEILFLGLYESEDDWQETDDQSEKDKREHRLKRYHTQQYVNGSKCDLNAKQRQTEVRFVCEEGSADYIARVDEPETCAYIMTIHTMKICHHPFLKPPTPTRTVAITCNPLLTLVQYQEYLNKLEAKELEKKLAEEKQKEEDERKRLAEEKAKYYKENQLKKESEDGQVEVEGEDETPSIEGPDKLTNNQAHQQWSEMMKNAKTADGSPLKMKTVVKYVDNPADVKDFLNEAMEEMLKLKTDPDGVEDTEEVQRSALEKQIKVPTIPEHAKPKFMDPKELESRARRQSEEEGGEEEVGDPDLEEFDAEIKTLKERYQARREKLAAIKKKVRSSMEDQYAAIIKEAQEELAEEGVEPELDQNEAMKDLTKTIDDLLKKLDQTEKDIAAVDKELEQFAEYDPQGQTSTTPPVKKDDLPTAEGPSKMDLDERVKVRVSRLKPGQLTASDEPDIRDKQTEALEKSVTKELEKHGVEGGKIQVKIITTGYYDKDDETLHVLTEEESETFTNMIVTLIGGSVDADKEENQHSEMEENYSFVWGQDDTPHPPIAGDAPTTEAAHLHNEGDNSAVHPDTQTVQVPTDTEEDSGS